MNNLLFYYPFFDSILLKLYPQSLKTSIKNDLETMYPCQGFLWTCVKTSEYILIKEIIFHLRITLFSIILSSIGIN